jgi:hypothetical protein
MDFLKDFSQNKKAYHKQTLDEVEYPQQEKVNDDAHSVIDLTESPTYEL